MFCFCECKGTDFCRIEQMFLLLFFFLRFQLVQIRWGLPFKNVQFKVNTRYNTETSEQTFYSFTCQFGVIILFAKMT